ncbi:MAG: hypothetical protein ABIE75_00745 [Candidatus Omnitrophota bacterium]
MNNSNDIIVFLKENLEILDQKIKENEEKFSCRCEKVFLELPWETAQQKVVEDTVTLKTRKKITSRDITRAKREIEEKFLNWDDFCIHNIVIKYEVEGTSYYKFPLGVWAKKIKLQSFLVWIKDKVQKGVEDIFDNLDRNLGGMIAPQISRFSSVFTAIDLSELKEKGPRLLGGLTGRDRGQVVVSIDYDKSRFIARSSNNFVFDKEFNFSFRKIIEELAKRFILKVSLAEEIFQRYISFKEIPYFKEITVKRDSGYVKLSTQTINSFVKDYIKSEICYILQEIKEGIPEDDFTVSFIGRLNLKEGFYGFLKDYVPYNLKTPLQKLTVSSSYGCLHYGVSRFLELNHKRNEPILRRVLDMYREYF